MSASEVLRMQKGGVIVVDTRAGDAVRSGARAGVGACCVNGAVRVVGGADSPAIAAEDDEHERESQMRLARMGIENVVEDSS